MSRPDPWRLSADAYPHHETIQTRFQDLDVLGHINNVGMAAILESGRVKFNKASGLDAWRAQQRWLVAQVIINYLGEGHFPADVVVSSGIGPIGTRSWTILSTAFSAWRANCHLRHGSGDGPRGRPVCAAGGVSRRPGAMADPRQLKWWLLLSATWQTSD